MNDFEDKTKYNMNSAGEGAQFRPDPIIQARDEDNMSGKEMQPAEIIPQKPKSLIEGTLLSNQFMGAGAIQDVSPETNIISLLLRYKWMILAIFILVSAPTLYFIWTQVIPKYQAKAEVRVRPIIPRLVFRTEDNGAIPFYESFVNTQVSIMRSFVVLQRALEQEEVQATVWYKESPRSFAQRLRGNRSTSPIERLRDDLSIKPRRKTEIIDVAFIDSSDKDAKIVVNAVLEQYIRYIGEMSDATKDKLYRQLVDQYKSLENEILGREKISAELRRSLGTATPGELISARRFRLDATEARLNELKQSIAVLEWERKELEGLMKEPATDDSDDALAAGKDEMEAQSIYFEDDKWREMDISVRTIRHKIDNSLRTAHHPDMIRIAKDLKFAEELLRLREMQLDKQLRNRVGSMAGSPVTITGSNGSVYKDESRSLEYQAARAKQEEKLLLTWLEKQQAELGSLFESAQLLEKENNTLSHKREFFNTVRQRLEQKNMERNVPGSIDVLTWAFTSSEPFNDRRIIFTAMALFLGLGMGGGAAFLRSSRNQTIYAAKDIPHQMQIPFLGHIPLTCDKKSSDDAVGAAMLVESIRFVRTALLSRLDGLGSTTVLVTSSDAGTGKSKFTMMLGKSLAQIGKKVLMIDADFQKMSLTKQFDLYKKPGLIQFMRRKSIDQRHIFPTETFGLSIVPAGKRRDDEEVFEEIANGAFKACMRQLRKQYDIILIDNSPILVMADATILSGQVDGTIMVERELVSQRANVIDALTRLKTAGGTLFGTVFVGSESYEKYRYSYNYGNIRDSEA